MTCTACTRRSRAFETATSLADDAVVAIEAVERAGELERIAGEQMHAAVTDDVGEELGEAQAEPDDRELAGRREQRQVGAFRRDPALGGGAEDARDPRVRVLHVVDGVVVRLLHRELEVEVELAVGAALQ